MTSLATVASGSRQVRVEHGDCQDVMHRLISEGMKVHSVVSDPPYHLHSIVKRFSKTPRNEATVGKHAYGRHAAGFMGRSWDGGDIAWNADMWRLCYDLMLPGAFIVAFSSSRTFGRMSVALEDAGFITHPMIGWLFATGFPKATRLKIEGMDGWRYGAQALKPELEPIYMGQKPLDGTGTENWLKHGCGALNIDGCRIGTESTRRTIDRPSPGSTEQYRMRRDNRDTGSDLGRWPANLVHDGSDEVIAAFPQSDGQQRAVGPEYGAKASINTYGDYGPREHFAPRADTGSAARFFFSAKADADDRWGSKHPTVKPVDLMRWLARLVTPPGGTVLDPFAGSGTTGVACLAEGFDCILIEREDEYLADIETRLAHYRGEGKHSLQVKNRNAKPGDLGPLFGEDAQ